MHVGHHLGLTAGPGGPTNTPAPGDPGAAGRALVGPDHETRTGNPVKSGPKIVRHEPVKDRHNTGHPRNPVRFTGDQATNFRFRLRVKPLFFLISGNLHALLKTEN